ncbi:RxLR-like protein [Phytophthora cinnamomi]|uniref:RxLR-like protein n=1 Tax=Phytophthora cinnamomi TaxID=4785 RepID=UPI003559EE0A|nr:RxLR-like protein [Phytophthora cinnamomi]
MACGKLKALGSLWLVILLLGVVVSTTDGQQVGTNCSNARIRRSWDTYNATEKALYLEAVGVAMDKGFHAKFIEIHTEMMSEREAHGNCMFIYWHRMMLLGYENMLRSLDPKYSCVTLPYWDHLSNSARQTVKSCSSLRTCAPVITETGGTLGVTKTLTIYNSTISTSSTTTCYTQAPLSHFCGTNTRTCAQCIIRKTQSALSSTPYPSAAMFATVSSDVMSSNSYATFTNKIEQDIHNMIHSVLGGVMAYLVSPADPIFYLHHALVDLLQVIYLKCQLGSDSVLLSATAKGSDPRWFATCLRRSSSVSYTTADNVTLHGADGKPVQDPSHPLYPFFKDLPYRFVDYVDAKDLGNYSYTYTMSGGLGTMYQNCGSSTTLSAATSLLADESENEARGGGPDSLRPIIEPGTADDDTVRRWTIALYEAARIVGYSEAAATEQMEMVACRYQDDCLGGVQDYTDLFRTNFGVDGHPRCYTVMQYLNSGDRVIGIPKWKEITARFLPCAAYKTRAKTAFEKAVEKYADATSS